MRSDTSDLDTTYIGVTSCVRLLIDPACSSPMSSLGVISDFITSFHSNPLENEMILRLFPGQELPESLVRRHGEEQIQPHTGWLGGFLGGQVVKNTPADTGDPGSILRLGRSPGGGHGNLLQYSHLENPHGQRSLVGYSP